MENFLREDKKDLDQTVRFSKLIRWTHMSEGTFSNIVAHLFYQCII